MKKIPRIQDCKSFNCVTHFPQFSTLTNEKLKKSLRETILEYESDKKSYFKDAYPNAKELIEAYKVALILPFIKACILIFNLKDSYIRYDMYINKRGGICVHEPCCR